jgi:diacylglycerol O-acyltransferase
MDQEKNPMMITVILKLKGQIDDDQYKQIFEGVARKFRRFRQRLIYSHRFLNRPYWVDVTDLKISDQLERVKLQLPANDQALMELVSRKMSTPIDSAHPLWQVTLVDNYAEGNVIIIRIHHCIADGISLMQVLMQMTKNSPDEAIQISQAIPDAKFNEARLKRNRDILYGNYSFLELLVGTARIFFRYPDPPTILKGPLGQLKKAVWSEPFDLQKIKKIARTKQATSNDILMAIASRAIKRYLDLHGDYPKRNIRAFTMVNLRRHFLDEDLGNKFGLVFLTLPLDCDRSLECLEQIKNGMDRLKNSAEMAASYRILNILGMMPAWIERLATKFLDTKGTVVATNVSGPHHQIYLAGAPIQSIIAWVPQSGRIGVGWSFVSYKDQVFVGVNADAHLIPDPEKFLEFFNEEYQSIQAVMSTSISD